MEKDVKKKNNKEEPSKGKTLTGEPVTPVELEPNIMEQSASKSGQKTRFKSYKQFHEWNQ